MENRVLVAEFDQVQCTRTGPAGDPYTFTSEGRALNTQTFVQETKIDLTGYTMEDKTVYFRSSFEQKGSINSIFWGTSYNPNFDSVMEITLVSTVPFTDEQLLGAFFVNPGFSPGAPAGGFGFEYGNFNRSHIIHGRHTTYYASSVAGAGQFNAAGNATLLPFQENYFSSLEPTAAENLYCYRILAVPNNRTPATTVSAVLMPPIRVIMDCMIDEEPSLEYMMRLKRSYELANQV